MPHDRATRGGARIIRRMHEGRWSRRLGIAGWIRNREDGAVVARVEGAPEAVDQFVAWSHEGPPAARVESVEVSEVSPEGIAGFDVLH